MPQRDAFCLKLFLHMRSINAGLDTGDQGFFINRQHAMHPAHIEAHDEPPIAILRLNATGDIRAPAKWNEHGVVLVGGFDNRHHVGLAGGVDDEIRREVHLSAPQAKQVAKGFAGGVDESVFFVDGKLAVRQYIAQRGDERRILFGGGQMHVIKLHRRRGFDLLQPQLAAEVRPQLWLVGIAEAHVLVTPAPPFHMANLGVSHGVPSACECGFPSRG